MSIQQLGQLQELHCISWVLDLLECMPPVFDTHALTTWLPSFDNDSLKKYTHLKIILRLYLFLMKIDIDIFHIVTRAEGFHKPSPLLMTPPHHARRGVGIGAELAKTIMTVSTDSGLVTSMGDTLEPPQASRSFQIELLAFFLTLM